EEPGLLARGYYADLRHDQTGRQQFDGGAWVFDGDRGYDRWLAGPTLGEHNAEVLSGVLGLSEERIADLAARGVIRDRPPV
ncbi:MAG: CoA transferase, partial [Dehalococcoidia bacterium]|nr:CoA transferase [Dehalococcoidia bacterium]